MSELSRVEDLLVTGVEQPVEPMSRMEAILRGDDIKPQSRIEELLKQYDPGGGGAIEFDDLSVTANGLYTPQENHAYKSVDVAVPAPPAPVLDDVTFTQNGVYTSEHDGYDEVTVAVPAPVLDTLSVTENGTYVSEHDGYSTVTVNVPGGTELEVQIDRGTILYQEGGATTWDAVNSYTTQIPAYAEVELAGDGYTYMFYLINGTRPDWNGSLSDHVTYKVLLNPGDTIAKRVDSGGGSPYFKMTIYPAIILGPAGHVSLERLIPKLTANDSYSGGEAICDSAATNTSVNFRDRNFPLTAWHAFDDNDNTSWCCNNTGTNGWIGYHWNDPVYLKYIAMRLPQDMLTDRSSNSVYVRVHTSMDGTNWELQREFQYTKDYESYIVFKNYITCKYFKITFNETNAGWDNYLGVIGIRAYGMKYPYQSSDNVLLCSGAQTVDKENWTQYYMPMDTITEGSLYDAYLSYDSSTKQFTVLQDFYGLIQCTLTNEYKAQSLACMELRHNNSNEGYAGARWKTPTDDPGSTKTRSFGLPLTTGDIFGLYTPNTDGWGFGKIKVYKVDGIDES